MEFKLLFYQLGIYAATTLWEYGLKPDDTRVSCHDGVLTICHRELCNRDPSEMHLCPNGHVDR